MEEQTIGSSPISFADIDGWAEDDHAAAFPRCSGPAARGRPATQLAPTRWRLGEQGRPRGGATLLRDPLHAAIVSMSTSSPASSPAITSPSSKARASGAASFRCRSMRRPDDLVQRQA